MNAEADKPANKAGERVFKNAGFLMVAQIAMLPMSVVINAVLGRFLGPGELGRIYLVTTYTGLAILFVSWGQSGTLPSRVARDFGAAGSALGTAILFQVLASLVALPAVLAFSHLVGNSVEVQQALFVAFVGAVVGSISAAYLSVGRGFERSDITAKMQLTTQVLNTVCVIPTVLLGGRVMAVLLVQGAVSLLMALPVARRVRSLWDGGLTFEKTKLREFAIEGTPFFLLGLAMTAQPSLDAAFLSRFAPEEAIGWYAVSRRLLGVLVLPAVSMSSALYPALCRAWASDRHEYAESFKAALKVAAMFAIPAAVGCGFYPDLGVFLFSRTAFGPAEDNLVIFSFFLPLVYVTMVLGTAVVAAGAQKKWAVVQSACIVVSLVLDPLLIPYFQDHYGNGGLGLCISSIASEVLMLIGGIWLMDRSAFRGAFSGQVRRCVLAGVAMGLAAFATRPFLGSWLSAPVSVGAYVGALWLQGGLTSDQLRLLKGMMKRG